MPNIFFFFQKRLEYKKERNVHLLECHIYSLAKMIFDDFRFKKENKTLLLFGDIVETYTRSIVIHGILRQIVSLSEKQSLIKENILSKVILFNSELGYIFVHKSIFFSLSSLIT